MVKHFDNPFNDPRGVIASKIRELREAKDDGHPNDRRHCPFSIDFHWCLQTSFINRFILS
jgi:hypothetical protein